MDDVQLLETGSRQLKHLLGEIQGVKGLPSAGTARLRVVLHVVHENITELEELAIVAGLGLALRDGDPPLLDFPAPPQVQGS